MPIQCQMKADDGLLWVRVWGEDGGVDDVSTYFLRVLETARESGCRGILVDERQREYRLDTVDLLTVAELCSRQDAWFRRAALVCHPRHLYDASFWETAAVNRGMNVRVFTSLREALAWIGTKRQGGAIPAA